MDDLGVPPILGNPQIDIDVPLNDPWASQRSCAARRRQADCTTTAAWSMFQWVMLYLKFCRYGGFAEIGVPAVVIHFNGIFPYKPSMLGYPIYGKPHMEVVRGQKASHDNLVNRLRAWR